MLSIPCGSSCHCMHRVQHVADVWLKVLSLHVSREPKPRATSLPLPPAGMGRGEEAGEVMVL